MTDDVTKARAVLAAAEPAVRRVSILHAALAGPALELLEAAGEFYEATTMNLGPCTIPYHNGEPCYECHIAGEQARAEHEAEARVTAALDSMRAALREAVGT